MPVAFSRRNLFHLAGAAAGAMLGSRLASAQQPQTPAPAPRPGRSRGSGGHPDPFPALQTRSSVSLVHGADRRKNVYEALLAIDPGSASWLDLTVRVPVPLPSEGG